MLFSRTPFRISLGGGSTDLPSYSEKFGGFIFGAAIKMYMDIFVRHPVIYDRIDLQYLNFESVESPDQLKHPIGREALKLVGVNKSISIYFKADTPMGTGLGSSGSCAVGLLNALWTFKGVEKKQDELAEEAFQITQRLGFPDGKQDPYLVALGGFTVLEIGADQAVQWYHPEISQETAESLKRHSLFFYTGVRRESVDILRAQDSDQALKLKHRTKEIGRQILRAFVDANLEDFGFLLNEHWCLKREMSDKISSPEFDHMCEFMRKNGALGVKLIGAGGGGYLFAFCRNEEDKKKLSLAAGKEFNFKEVPFSIDYKGARVAEIEI